MVLKVLQPLKFDCIFFPSISFASERGLALCLMVSAKLKNVLIGEIRLPNVAVYNTILFHFSICLSRYDIIIILVAQIGRFYMNDG